MAKTVSPTLNLTKDPPPSVWEWCLPGGRVLVWPVLSLRELEKSTGTQSQKPKVLPVLN